MATQLIVQPLLIGMAPGHGDPMKPLEGRVGRRIADLAGIEYETYLSRTQRVNLIEQDVPSTMPWPAKEARARAEKLLHLFAHRLVLLLGRRVAEAFGVGQQPYFLPTRILSTGAVVVVPHPSGLNRWWNDPNHVAEARGFLTEVLGDREPATVSLKEIRTAVADYLFSEGCSCCEGANHKEHREVLGRLLQAEPYEDGSGHDFRRYRTREKK